MRSRHRAWLSLLAVLLVAGAVSPLAGPSLVRADAIAEPAFSRVWSRTDQPVARGAVTRTWFWGPEPLGEGIYERYLDSPGTERRVQYFDKGRMEIIQPSGDRASPWYVTSGLLTRELISGRIQIGRDSFLDAGGGAAIPVAGDPDNPFPTYRDLAGVIDQGQPDRTGQAAATWLHPDGSIARDEALATDATQYVQYISYTGPQGTPVGYNVPRAFWAFMTQPGLVERDGALVEAAPLFDWLFVLGYPLSDPFWVRVRVAGVERDVMVQPFERRLLTYTPANPPGWQVEMGNIGRHYQAWRYRGVVPGDLSGDRAHFALEPSGAWDYSTNVGLDETWKVIGTARGFDGGSTLAARREQRGSHHFVTYWSVDANGVALHGSDRLDFAGNVTDSTLYRPAVRFLPPGDIAVGDTWSTDTTALSMSSPPRTDSVSVEVLAYELVATPAGFFPAWKLRIRQSDPGTAPEADALAPVVWFSPGVGIVQWLGGQVAGQLTAASTIPSPNQQ